MKKRFERIEDLDAALKRKRVYGFNFADNFMENFPRTPFGKGRCACFCVRNVRLDVFMDYRYVQQVLRKKIY